MQSDTKCQVKWWISNRYRNETVDDNNLPIKWQSFELTSARNFLRHAGTGNDRSLYPDITDDNIHTDIIGVALITLKYSKSIVIIFNQLLIIISSVYLTQISKWIIIH